MYQNSKTEWDFIIPNLEWGGKKTKIFKVIIWNDTSSVWRASLHNISWPQILDEAIHVPMLPPSFQSQSQNHYWRITPIFNSLLSTWNPVTQPWQTMKQLAIISSFTWDHQSKGSLSPYTSEEDPISGILLWIDNQYNTPCWHEIQANFTSFLCQEICMVLII